MARKRKRRRGLIGKNERYEGRRSRDREDYEKRRIIFEDVRRRYSDAVRRDIDRRWQHIKRIDRHVYTTMYQLYRNLVNQHVRGFMYRIGKLLYGKPDMVNPTRKWSLLRRILPFLFEDIYDWLYDYLIYERPLLDARNRLRIRGDARRIRRIRDEIRNGVALPLVITRYYNRTIELYFHEKLDEYLNDPARLPLVLDALNHIFTQLLSTSYRIVIPPEELERLKEVLAILYKYYVAYTRPMPCTRSQFLVKLTPVTLHIARGYAVRLYVLRWTSGYNLRSGILMITDPIDLYFVMLRNKKYNYDIFSSLQAIGETSALSGDETVYTWRDWMGIGRDAVKLYQLLYRHTVVEDGFRRATGKRENIAEIGHCSVYIGFHLSHRRFRYWWYERERILCKQYHIC